jgi:hypothetical protein
MIGVDPRAGASQSAGGERLRPAESYRAEGPLVPLTSPTDVVSAIRSVDSARWLAFPGYRAMGRSVRLISLQLPNFGPELS